MHFGFGRRNFEDNKMEIKRGIPVSPGVAIGPALVVETEGVRIPRRFIDKSQCQKRNRAARVRPCATRSPMPAPIRTPSARKLGKQYGAIFAAHAMLIEDPELVREIEQLITQKNHAAEYAVSRDDAPARQGAGKPQSSDVQHAGLGPVRHREIDPAATWSGRTANRCRNLKEPVIILAHDLTPSETANLDPKMVYAFATEAGGQASHTAIMAGVLEIPAVVGLGRFLTDVSGGDEVIVDGNRGILILNPDEETRERYVGPAEAVRHLRQTASTSCAICRPRPSDGTRVDPAGQHRISPGSHTIASTAAPTASACIAPSSSI